jgi:hypothetical protein
MTLAAWIRYAVAVALIAAIAILFYLSIKALPKPSGNMTNTEYLLALKIVHAVRGRDDDSALNRIVEILRAERPE